MKNILFILLMVAPAFANASDCLTGNCGYNLCTGILKGDCAGYAGADYNLCVGIVDKDCAGYAGADYSVCENMLSAISHRDCTDAE